MAQTTGGIVQCLYCLRSGCLLQKSQVKEQKDTRTLSSHLRTPDTVKRSSNVQYIHLSRPMPMELVLIVHTTKATVQQRFVISKIYDSSFGLNVLNGGKVIF